MNFNYLEIIFKNRTCN